jgi:hypothetical protein
MPSIEITGGEQLRVIAAKFRQEAHGDLDRELQAALERASKPLREDAKASALEHLPHRGGLNVLVAAAAMILQRRAGGIRIVAHGMSQLSRTNAGEVRHPVWGDREVWVTQVIPRALNWFYKPMQDGAGKVEEELKKALDKVARKIA